MNEQISTRHPYDVNADERREIIEASRQSVPDILVRFIDWSERRANPWGYYRSPGGRTEETPEKAARAAGLTAAAADAFQRLCDAILIEGGGPVTTAHLTRLRRRWEEWKNVRPEQVGSMACSFATDMQRSLTPDQERLYLLGWRVWGDPDGFKLEFVDNFANRKDKFGSHETAERAWEIAALLSAKPKAITSTGRP